MGISLYRRGWSTARRSGPAAADIVASSSGTSIQSPRPSVFARSRCPRRGRQVDALTSFAACERLGRRVRPSGAFHGLDADYVGALVGRQNRGHRARNVLTEVNDTQTSQRRRSHSRCAAVGQSELLSSTVTGRADGAENSPAVADASDGNDGGLSPAVALNHRSL
ncbi:hypothetical protein ACVWY6_003704 [Williamsia sp. R60]